MAGRYQNTTPVGSAVRVKSQLPMPNLRRLLDPGRGASALADPLIQRGPVFRNGWMRAGAHGLQ